MNTEDQLVIVAQCLYRITPEITKYVLKRLEPTDAYAVHPDQEFGDARRQLLSDSAALAIELASHMAAQYAGFYDAAISPQTQDPAAAQRAAAFRQYRQKNPAQEIL